MHIRTIIHRCTKRAQACTGLINENKCMCHRITGKIRINSVQMFE